MSVEAPIGELTATASWQRRAERVLPGGVNSNVRLSAPPRMFARAAGARLWDVDGRDYIDYLLGQGPQFLGHAHAGVGAAVAAATATGMLYGGQHTLEVQAAERLLNVLGWADQVRLGVSGTEAVQGAVRLARAVTGRGRVVRFTGSYHGWLDNVLMAYPPAGAGPASAGQAASQLSDWLVVPYNDPVAVQAVFDRHGPEIAAVLVEPVMCNTGVLAPVDDFLGRLRRLCTRNGTVLIFDEVITGFRLAPGGAAEHFGVAPDVAVYGKALAGGWPVSAIAGRAELMQHFGSGEVNHSGTFNGSVMAAAAVDATLRELQENPPYERIAEHGQALMDGLSSRLAAAGVPAHVQGFPAVFHVALRHPDGSPDHIRTACDMARFDADGYARFAALLADHGLWVAGRGIWFVSASHGPEELDVALDRVSFGVGPVDGAELTGRRPTAAIVGLWHETNTYGPRPATLEDWVQYELVVGAEVIARHGGVRSVIGGFLACDRLQPVPVLSAGAWPSGPTTAEALANLLRRIRTGLEAAGPVDAVLLNLHGAMVGAGCPDVEHELLALVRSIVGDSVAIGAVLDLHANPSVPFVELCDVVIAYETYPHVDMWERGLEVAELIADAVAGRRMHTRIAKTPLLTCPLAQATDAEPMRGLLDRAHDRASAAGIVHLSITPGFAYSDVERAGTSVLVVTDDDRADAADAVLHATVLDIEAMADAFAVDTVDVGSAVATALDAATPKPVVLADLADNVGGGSAGDGTALVAELLRRDAPDAVAVLADPKVVDTAVELGVGATVELSIGGKLDRLHGDPLRVRARVVRLSDGRYTTAGSWMTGQTFDMGRTAVLAVDGVQLVVTERATPPFHREQLTSVGIDPAECAALVAKGAVAWRSAFGADARTVLLVDTPGACPVDVGRLPRTTVPVRVVPRPASLRSGPLQSVAASD